MTMSTNYSQTNTTAMTAMDSATELSDAGKAADRPWDTSDPFISAQARDLLATVFKCYIRHVVLYVGIFGNAICCVVFRKQGLSDRINLLLFWLAVVDFLNLFLQLPTTLTCFSSDAIFLNNVNVIVSAKISRVFVIFGNISGNLIVVMSVERCLFVVIPFKARRLLTYRSMIVAILLAHLIPFLAYLPQFLAGDVTWRVDPSTNRSIAYMSTASWFPEGRLQTLIPTYIHLIGQPLSLLAIVICSIITVVHLHQTSLKRAEMTGKATEEESAADKRLTVMLLFLCIVYAIPLVCQIINSTIHDMLPEFYMYRRYHNSFITFQHVFVLTSSCLNSSINFCAYLVLSSRFRATLKEIWPCFNNM